jgi:prepilin-type N-terminal cleavage/methylation domain-containing protein
MTSPISANIDPTRCGKAARRDRAFSIAELLVVIGIIGVLAALLLPAVGRARRAAARVAQGNDLQTIAVALEAYKQDFGDYPRVRREAAPAMLQVDYSVARSSPDQLWRPNPQTGAELLCLALMGQAEQTDLVAAPMGYRARQDGANGLGFRARRQMAPGPDGVLGNADDIVQGKTYPPYLSADQFKIGARETDEVKTDPDLVLHFNLLDRNNMPILYFPASLVKSDVKRPPVAPALAPYVDSAYLTASTTDDAEHSRYDADDNIVWFINDPYKAMAPSGTSDFSMGLVRALKRIRVMLGDRDSDLMTSTAPFTPNGSIQPYETAIEQPFLLWSAGPDLRFGPESDRFSDGPDLTPGDITAAERCDDVTNFRP